MNVFKKKRKVAKPHMRRVKTSSGIVFRLIIQKPGKGYARPKVSRLKIEKPRFKKKY